MLKKFLTAITALAIVASLLAGTAGTAAAATGFNSAYFGESAFLTLAPGASGQFAVGFNNTGSTGWLIGSSSQVDLAICLPDKTTCNVTSPNAAFASSWLSSTAYATTSTTFVGPGQTGFFQYNVTAPTSAAAGTYRFNGDLALHNTASMINPQGYFQDVEVAQPGTAPTITSLTPNTGSSAGGTSVVIAGTGFICNPVLPTVNFGAGNPGTVTSCGASSITVTSPAHAVGTVSVTVSNAGGAASNGIDYIYADTTKPVLNSITATGNGISLTFSEAVCRSAAFAAGDYSITVNGIARAATADSSTACNGTFDNGTTTFDVTVGTAFVNGDVVALTLTAGGGAKLRDTAGNTPDPQTRTATATGDTTKPSMASAISQSNAADLKITYSEAVTCAAAAAGTQFSVTPTGGTPVAGLTAACAANPPGSATVTVTFPAATFASGVGGSVTYTAGANPITDRVGNTAVTPQTIAYTSFSSDASRPLSQDVRIKTSAGFAGLLDSGDVWTAAFNEVMATPAAGSKVRLTDADGTFADVTCGTNATCVVNVAAVTIGGTSYPIGQVITFTMTADPTIVTAGTIAGLALPGTVTDSAGIVDTATNAWDIPGSPDKTLN